MSKSEESVRRAKTKKPSPLSNELLQVVACIAVVLYAIENKYLTDVEKDKMQSFEENLRTHFKSNYGDVWEEVNKTGDWNEDLDKKFKEIVSSFMKEGSW